MKGVIMVAIFLIGLIIGIGIQDEYNVTNKEPIIELQTQIQYVDKVIEVEKTIEVYKVVKPKLIECEAKVVW